MGELIMQEIRRSFAAATPSPVPPSDNERSLATTHQPTSDLAALQRVLAGVTEYLRTGLHNLTTVPSPDPAVPEAAAIHRELERTAADLRKVLGALETTITRAAIGAAHNSARLQAVASRMQDVHVHLNEIGESSEQLAASVQLVAQAAGEAAHGAQQADQFTEKGLELSQQAVAAGQTLRQQMQLTTERLGNLMEHVRAVTRVSQVIEGIAKRTNLLALNAAIEAARAGAHGRGFAVVASEVHKLADNTAAQTREINGLIRTITDDLQPAQAALQASDEQVHIVAARSEEVGASLNEIYRLVRQSSERIEDIAAAVEQQTAAMQSTSHGLKEATAGMGVLQSEAQGISKETFALSELTEGAYPYLVRYNTGSIFHRVLRLGRELSQSCQAILEQVIDQGRCTLSDVLELRYTEITGPAIRNLARLFDVSRVPASGFSPPKFSTAYDALVDEALQRVGDAVLQQEPKLIYGLVLDLNSYAPIHNKIYCKDWTGVPEKDLVGNRAKRFFFDQRVLVRGARVGLGAAAARLPNQATRQQFQQAGCSLRWTQEEADGFLVQTYARDTGAFVTSLAIPVYVKAQRYGAVFIGWNEDGSR